MVGGVLVVDKPRGPTSFEVVQRVRRALRASKAGHTGTLDPAATGVLAVCLDDAVKLQGWLVDGDKEYEATVVFGAATETEDAEGPVVAEADASGLDEGGLRAALGRFVGEVEQVPPMYSAVRIGGRRLHEAARAGEHVDRAPRRVRIDALDLLDFTPVAEAVPSEGGPTPVAEAVPSEGRPVADEHAARAVARVRVRCGKGTYVRTLAVDLGRALGLPAHLGALRRTAAGSFTLEQALPLSEVERLAAVDREALARRVVSPGDALGHMPAVRLTDDQARDVAHGRALALPEAPAVLFRGLAPDGRLLALLEPAPPGARPVRVFAPAGQR